MSDVSAFVSGYTIDRVVHLNSDQLALALLKAGEKRASEIVEQFRDGIKAATK